MKNIRNLFQYEQEDYYKPVTVGNIWSNSYIEYESNGDRNKTLLVEEYLNTIRPYVKDIITNIKKSDRWKIQLTISINFISSKDNDEEPVMHSESDNIEFMVNDQVGEVIEALFESLLNRYQIRLETSVILYLGSDFIFDCVYLLYYMF